MNAVKKYLFWIILAVVLVASGIVHVMVVTPLQQKTADLRAKAQKETKRAETLAKNQSEIVTANHVKEALAYRKHLEDQEKELVSLWSKTAKFDMDPKFNEAKSKEDIGFEQWLNDRRADIQKQVDQAGLKLPANFEKDFLYAGETVDRSKIPVMVDRLALLFEVLNVLTSVKVPVTVPAFEPDMKTAEKLKATQVGVLALNGLRFYDNTGLQARDQTTYTKVLQLGGLSYGTKVSNAPTPFTRRGFSVTVTVPFTAVPALIRALETNSRYLGVVRLVDVQRVAAAYPNPSEIQSMAPGKELKLQERLQAGVNTYYTEAPVQVQIDVDMLNFDQEAAKKMATPPAPKKAAGRRR